MCCSDTQIACALLRRAQPHQRARPADAARRQRRAGALGLPTKARGAQGEVRDKQERLRTAQADSDRISELHGERQAAALAAGDASQRERLRAFMVRRRAAPPRPRKRRRCMPGGRVRVATRHSAGALVQG